MAKADLPPELIGRKVFLWTAASAIAFALVASLLTS
jgi:hypothetical protein